MIKSELFRYILNDNSTFENPIKGVRYSEIIKWSVTFSTEEKNVLRDNLETCKQNNVKYLIFVKENYIEVRRVLRLRGGMIDDLQFEVEVPNIDLSVMDNFMFGDDFFWMIYKGFDS
jgi:hypothetical protein